LDLAIAGEGFFKIQLYDGTFAYTRDGSFKIDSKGQIVNSNGYLLEPPLTLPDGVLHGEISISNEGVVTVKVGGDDTPLQVGQVNTFRFMNPAGLQAIGGNLFKESQASGTEVLGQPGHGGYGTLEQGFLEMSNVKVVEEMVNMIVAQRAYETNSKAIHTSDSMLNTAINLKR
jgi:flagellar basal-body rod protein FlgG